MTVKEALGHALRHLEQYGWIQGAMGSSYGPCCAARAINVVCMDYDVIDQAECHLAATIGPRRVEAAASIVAWNDSPGMTFELVAATFRRAIETAP